MQSLSSCPLSQKAEKIPLGRRPHQWAFFGHFLHSAHSSPGSLPFKKPQKSGAPPPLITSYFVLYPPLSLQIPHHTLRLLSTFSLFISHPPTPSLSSTLEFPLMDSKPPSSDHPPQEVPTNTEKEYFSEDKSSNIIIFDSSQLCNQASIPSQFFWPQTDLSCSCKQLKAPIIDLNGFLTGDKSSTKIAIDLVHSACSDHGFFQVINHGVDSSLMQDALNCIDEFFRLPLAEKLKARRKGQSKWGYAGAHTDRFTDKLPWKETLSLGYDSVASQSVFVDYLTSTLGNGFKEMGIVYQRYCDAMTKLSLSIMELLGISLGVDGGHYREFFAESTSILRCNYYPPCQEPELTFGTGPHCDPTSLTILLQQDEVDGLQVFSGGEWRVVRPLPGALVINIGDTFMFSFG
ncbi:hypothetical protein M5K25_011186 [Dendrobium thyrsiflorum]|uniref:Fe2OG dioxygenase domain-containing protein n=1 Tax=Dendrobium thyrsiflorum TaxID=117978 RepID=A0ABD0V2E5_DENTH